MNTETYEYLSYLSWRAYLEDGRRIMTWIRRRAGRLKVNNYEAALLSNRMRSIFHFVAQKHQFPLLYVSSSGASLLFFNKIDDLLYNTPSYENQE